MDHENQYQKSRQERIREARENCSRCLNQGPLKSSEKEAGPPYIKGKLQREEPSEGYAVKKGTLIRLFIAGLLFLAIFITDQFSVKMGQFDPQKVAAYLGEDIIVQWEDQAASLMNEKILPVFKNINPAD